MERLNEMAAEVHRSSWRPERPSSRTDDALADDATFVLRHAMRLVEEQGQAGFWIQDVSTDRIIVSPGLARITGVPVTVRRTRDSMLRSIHPQDRPHQADLPGLMDCGQPVRREFRIVRPDGTIRWTSSRIDVVLDDDGRPVRFVGVLVDITDQREAQCSVAYNQGRHAAFLEATSGLRWTADADGRVVDCGAWSALTGLAPENCLKEGWCDAVHPDDRGRVGEAFRTALANRDMCDVDCRVLTRDGVHRWYSARLAPVRDAEGAVREWEGVLLPIEGGRRVPAADDAPTLTGEQIRGARGLLDWSLAQLAAASGVSVSTIKRMEDGSEGNTRASKSEAVRRALQAGGVAFRVIDGTIWMGR